ncbi:DNA-3-methyladenine glycosylase family protein [Tamaricihabitans halophyticus]|nr:DNA-3-methyladenine glycosylase 2 family protein [Tamaricihabitans halophyticus]
MFEAGRELDQPDARLVWTPPFPLDLSSVLAPLRRGGADPAFQRAAGGTCWLTANTTEGAATIALRRDGAEVRASAWGAGAQSVVDDVPRLLGAFDDDAGFAPVHPVVAEARRRMPGLRLGATGRVWDVLIPSVLEQKVTGSEARRSWRELCRRFGCAAPGPAPAGMRVPPKPVELLRITDWQWHRAGVDGARRRTLIAAAQVAHRLERAANLGGAQGRALLRKVPGIGPWTAAEIAQRVWGDPDAVSVGDFHLPSTVGHALVGRRLDDAGMLEALEPYAPQRQRAVRYIEASGFTPPRYGPRFAPRDYRAI